MWIQEGNFIIISGTFVINSFISPNLWIPGKQCPKSQCPQPTFDSSNSSSFDYYDSNFSVDYDVGYAKGIRGTDNVVLSGISVKNQVIGVVTDTEDAIQVGIDYDGTSADGILGLSYPEQQTLNTYNLITSVPFNMMYNNLLTKPVFSIYTNSIYQENWSGEIVLGGYDETKYKNNKIYYIPVQMDDATDTYTLWQVFLQSIQATNNNRTITSLNQLQQAYISVDTGTTFTFVKLELVQSTLKSMNLYDPDNYDSDSGCYFVDCRYGRISSHYQVQFSFLSDDNDTVIQLNIPLQELVEPLDTIDINEASKCYFSICSAADDNAFIMGDSVLRAMYTVFDMENNRVGFAPSLGSNSSITTSNLSIYDSLNNNTSNNL